MTPDQCEVVRTHLSGWMLADALCGDDDARRRLAQSVYGCSHTRDGRPSWFQCGPKGVSIGLGVELTLVATWREIGAHLATLPASVEAETRAAYDEHKRLWGEHCRTLVAPWVRETAPTRSLARVIEADTYATAQEHLRGTLEPLLDRALTWTPPAAVMQPDIFDLLAEAP